MSRSRPLAAHAGQVPSSAWVEGAGREGGCGRVCSVRSCLLPSFVNVMAALNTFPSCAGLRGHKPSLSVGVTAWNTCTEEGSEVINGLLKSSQNILRPNSRNSLSSLPKCIPLCPPSEVTKGSEAVQCLSSRLVFYLFRRGRRQSVCFLQQAVN